MHRIRRRAEATAPPQRTLTLPFDRRQKSRLRARLDAIAGEVEGPEVAIELERGTSLGDGDLLEAEDGSIVLVRAQPESVSVARSSNALSLARAAYHLGNRHVPIQILVDEIRYQHDHVLDDMVSHLGVTLEHSVLPFQPEFGAYGSGHSHLSHGHGHSRGHGAHIHLHGHTHHHEHDAHGPHSHEGADHDSHVHEDAHDQHVHEDGNDPNAPQRHDDQGGTSQHGDNEGRSSRSRP